MGIHWKANTTMRLLSPITSVAFAALVALTFGNGAFASITIGDLQNGINYLEDDDFEGAILANGSTLEVNDVLFGLFQIQTLYHDAGPGTGTPVASNPVGPGTTFTGVFATLVTGKTANGTGWIYDFGAVADLTWNTLFPSNPRTSSDTAIKVYEDSTNPRIVDGVLTSADGIALWEFGFDASDPDVFWQSTSPTDDPSLLTQEAGFGGLGPASFGLILNETANFTNLTLLPHDFFTPTTGADGQLQGFGSIWAGPGGGLTPLRSDTDFVINVIPEPTTFVVWSVLGMVSATAIARKQRRS